MKRTVIIAAFVLFLSCRKEKIKEVPYTVYLNTCKITKHIVYRDRTTDIESTTLYYHTGNRIDSSVKFTPKRLVTYKYHYIDETTRRITPIFHKTKENLGYTMESLGNNGEIIETISFDTLGATLHWEKSTMVCE